MKIINIELLGVYKGYIVDEISSTNSYFKSEYQKYDDHSVLIAKSQTQGRGRYDRVWSSNGDITFSILYKKNNDYAIIVPVAIVLAFLSYNLNVGIKWPNDIYCKGCKLGGILIEDIFTSSLDAVVVGIGLNRYNKPELNGIGYSDFIDACNLDIIKKILYYIDYLSNISKDKIMQYYKEYSIVIGKKIIYHNIEYKVEGINNLGHLIIRNNDLLREIQTDEINIKEALVDEL